ncbi:type IX secretion system membrane protein PorP/SprF [Flavobacteriaceae bacterium M23B6Z8]
MNFKNHLLVLFSMLSWLAVFSQQNPQFSQYLQNSMVLNPAITGTENYLEFALAYRNQWTGFPGAPKTATFTFQSPSGLLFSDRSDITESHSGLGAFIYSDETGPISRSGYYVSYAYHLKVSNDWFVSLGTYVGGSQFRFDENEVVLVDNPQDILIQSFSTTNLDISLGMYAYSNYLFLGFSANQLLDSRIPYDVQSGVLTTGRLNRNFNFLIGSRISLDRDWTVIPAGVIRTLVDAPLQWDLSVKTEYQNRLWAGISYRNKESFYALAGFRLMERLSVSYSYDYPISELRNNQSGSHEIMISYRIFEGNKWCGCAVNSM